MAHNDVVTDLASPCREYRCLPQVCTTSTALRQRRYALQKHAIEVRKF